MGPTKTTKLAGEQHPVPPEEILYPANHDQHSAIILPPRTNCGTRRILQDDHHYDEVVLLAAHA